MKTSRCLPFGLFFALAGCGGAQKAGVVHDFADSLVRPACACTEQTPLAPSDVLGERTVQDQEADLARVWTGTLHWREQPWFAASGETRVELRFAPSRAYASGCPSAPTAECAERYAVFATDISSADALLHESLDVRFAFLPEANANLPVRPAGLWSHRKDASEPRLMMSLRREGDVLKGQLYVLAPEAGPDSSLVTRVVGDWEAASIPGALVGTAP